MKTFVLAAGALISLASGAMGATELYIDVNTLTAVFTNNAGGHGGFSTNSTGHIDITQNELSTLAGIRKDGINQVMSSTLASFSGHIDLLNGDVTGGFMTLTNADGSSYTTMLSATGHVATQAGQGFSIDSGTVNGLFNGPFLAGVSIGEFYFNQPRPGSVLTFAFNPNADGRDTTTDVDAYVFVPTPQAAGLGFAGLLGLGAARRRR